MTRIGVIGEALVDIVHRPGGGTHTAPGGSPANVALTIGRLGLDVTLITNLGNDAAGDTVRSWLRESGVVVEATPGRRTSTAVANLDDSGVAAYSFDIVWELDPVDTHGFDVIHIGSIAALLEPGSNEAVSAAKLARPHAVVTYDPNVRPALLGDAERYRGRVEELVRIADVVKVSDEDLTWLYPDRDPLTVAAAWQQQGPFLVVLTRGSEGAVAFTAAGQTAVNSPAVTVVDTVGAGDTFMGTLIAGLAHVGGINPSRAALEHISPRDLALVLEASAAAAASTVSRPGADPPWRNVISDC